MTQERFQAMTERVISHYAEEPVRIGTWEGSEAVSLARVTTEEYLPKGLATPGQYFRVIEDEVSGKPVGDLWYTLRSRGRRQQLFVEWIVIEEKHRRHGYATEALRQLEGEARRLGAYWVALGTAGDNSAALSLYGKLGFQPKNIFLAKNIPP